MNPTASEEQRQRIENFQRTNQLGLATLFFSDLVGSTQLKQNLGDRDAIQLIQAHHAAFRELLGRFPHAEEISTAGDSCFLIFAAPSDAVRFALLAQARTHALASESGCPLRDRIGIHVGEVFIEAAGHAGKVKDLFGIQVDTCARIMSLGEGDQILLSRFAFDNARQALRGDALEGIGELAWLNHGFYEMKGVEEPVEICEVGEVGRACLNAPEASEKGRRVVTGDEPVLGWRPAAEQLVPNTQWVLDRLLGEGGFGEVWLARHQTLKDRRVFKFCFNAEKARSLKREVTLFRVLREHVGARPGIVAVHDVYFDQPPYYIVMDHIDGPTLTGWAEAHAPLDSVPLETRLEIVAQIADALQTAHDAGVIHRDVKPSNILIAEEAGAPRAMLTDFGIGQLISKETAAGITQLGFTQTMMAADSMTGTQLYLAPELISGQPATIRSDIYALGIVLYQLFTGALNRPLTSDWADDIADPLLRDDIRNCVAGDPAKRFAGGAQLAAHLRTLPQRRIERETAERLQVRAERRKKQTRLASVAAATVAIAAVFFGLAFLRERDLKMKIALEGQRAEQTLTELRKTAPTFADQANLFREQGKFTEASEKIDTALQLVPESATYALQRAEILQALERWDEAITAFANARQSSAQSAYLAENEKLSRQIATILAGKQKVPKETWIILAGTYLAQKRYSELLILSQRTNAEMKQVMLGWQERINAYFGSAAPQLHLSKDGGLFLMLNYHPLTTLEPLRGCPLAALHMEHTAVSDLSPLESCAQLQSLNIANTGVLHLDSLRGLPLRDLVARGVWTTDIEPLRGMPLNHLELNLANASTTPMLTRLSPLRGMPLTYLNLTGREVDNLEALQGAPLESLYASGTGVNDLTPLAKAPLHFLSFAHTQVSDLGPLRGAPLEELSASQTRITSLEPLRGMKLRTLEIDNTNVGDLSPLAGMPLAMLAAQNIKALCDITPLAHLPLRQLFLAGTSVNDLTPLAMCRALEELTIPEGCAGMEVLRQLPELRRLSYKVTSTGIVTQPAKEFWTAYDAQQAAGKK